MAARTRLEKNYYRIMGLPWEATDDEIRRAYRRLALQWHPDRNPGKPDAAERFKEISEAYAVLIDPAKRREYDRARRRGGPGEFRHSREELFRDLFADPRASAIFEELSREFERIGMRVDRHYFQQTLFGGRTVISGGVFIITPFTPVFALLRLARAALRGARVTAPLEAPPAPPLPRPAGSLEAIGGAIGRIGRWLLGLPSGPSGAGALSPADVVLPLRLSPTEAERGGRKRVTLSREAGADEVLVTIPAGVRPGTRLRLRGKGRLRPGGARGDAYLAVEITELG
jgi:curved DNA-binding protein CbpA